MSNTFAPAYWKTTHYNHAGQALGDAFPESLNIVLQLDTIGTATYNLDITNPLSIEQNTRAYYTDFVITRGTRNIIAGVHTSCGNSDDSNNDILQISGQDWKHLFEGCTHPFDPTNPTANLYNVTDRDVALVIKDLLDTQLAASNRASFAYSLSAIGQTTNYQIGPSDSTDLNSRIATLAQTAPGFDFDVSPDLTRTFAIYSPTRGANNGYVFQEDMNCETVSYQSNGPKGTHVVGTASTAGGGNLGYVVDTPTQGTARRWDVYEDFDNVQDITQLTAYTQAQATRDDADQIAFTIKYIPQPGEDIFSKVGLGDTCKCLLTLHGYKNIDAFYRIVGIEINVTDEGEEEISFTMDYGSLSF